MNERAAKVDRLRRLAKLRYLIKARRRERGSTAGRTGQPLTANRQPLLLLLLGLLVAQPDAHAERIKDLATVAGVRGNQLIGYGLGVGLDGTGGQTSQAPVTVQSLRNTLSQCGRTLPAR